jgi:hypothetical protein
MRRRWFALVTGWLVGSLSWSATAAQAPSVPSSLAPATQLVGTWKLDRAKTKDGQDIWKRRLDAMRAAQEAEPADAAGVFALHTGHVPYTGDWQLKSAMRDLLEIAEKLSFHFADDSVTITDDLNRTLTFATTGTKEKRQLSATEFNARTRFSGGALTQLVTSDELAMTEVYLPSEDGTEMLVSITVAKPDFKPPLKDMMRVYTRVNDGARY